MRIPDAEIEAIIDSDFSATVAPLVHGPSREIGCFTSALRIGSTGTDNRDKAKRIALTKAVKSQSLDARAMAE